MDKEARKNTMRPLLSKALTDKALFDSEDKERFLRFSLGEITYEQLMVESTVKAERVQAELTMLTETLFQRMAEAQVATLRDLNRRQAGELRAVIRRIAGLLQFSWTGKFLTSSVSPDGFTPQGAPFRFDEEIFPEFLLLNFRSYVIEGPSGFRTVVIYAFETMQQILEVVFNELSQTRQSKRPL